jgi:glycosyltransferase involved in cell wall biosynthesis
MRIAYVSQQAPFGPSETFINSEVQALLDDQVSLLVIPLRPNRHLGHTVSHEHEQAIRRTGLLSRDVLWVLAKTCFCKPLHLWRGIRALYPLETSLANTAKNLVSLPKAMWIAHQVRKEGVTHIHAHWLSTSSTAAMVASRLTGVPYSVTAHRTDIQLRNLIERKAASAVFIRTIDCAGREEVRQAVAPQYRRKVILLHMGVQVPELSEVRDPPDGSRPLQVLVPAQLKAKKGHRFLFEAIARLQGPGVRFLIAGEGPLRKELDALADHLRIRSRLRFLGLVDHSQLLSMYGAGEIDLVVLPSIVTADGRKEGIPVSLMEAMAHGVPVISTATAGVPELVSPGAGWLVPPEDPEALSNAIAEAISDPFERQRRGAEGRAVVERDFSARQIASQLLALFGMA